MIPDEIRYTVEYTLYAVDFSQITGDLMGAILLPDLSVDVEKDEEWGRIVIKGHGPTWDLAAEVGGEVVDAYLKSGVAKLYPTGCHDRDVG